jgi:BASS family bile acid:Na+ symporter
MLESYQEYQEWLARIQLIFFMLGMGLNLTVHDFVRVARQPRSFLFAIVGQVCVIPFLALGINHLFGLEPRIALGLILVAAMPGGTISKVFTYLGRGNVPLSITLTAVSTLATLVTVPVTLRLLASAYVPDDFDMPQGRIIADVFLFLLIPLAAGMILARLVPLYRHPIARWCVRIGFVFVLLIVVGSLGSGQIRPAEHGLVVPLAIILFCVAGQQLNMVPFYVLPISRSDRLAAGIEVTMRNMNLALLLNSSLFTSSPALHDGGLFVILFYGAVAFGAGVPLALNHRRLWRREHAAQAAGAARSPRNLAV